VPRTPDDFSGVSIEEGLLLINDGYGAPGTPGEIRYSGGHFYAKDGYELFDVRTNVHEHILSHLADGTDSFYVISPNAPTSYEDENDGYEVGWRWIDTTDGYEFVLIDKTAGFAVWKNTTLAGGGGGLPDAHAFTHIHSGSDEIDGDKLNIDFDPTFYSPDTSPPEVDSDQELTAHLAGIDAYFGELDGYFIEDEEHKKLRHLIHFIDDGPAGGFETDGYKKIYPEADPFPVQTVWYDPNGKKIVEKNITRNANKTPSTIEWKMFDSDGIIVLETVTDTITYSGIFEINRTRSIS